MKLLLDTHILLWYLDDNANLSTPQRGQIEDRRNQVAVSAVSLWEITIKVSIGKLELIDDIATVENTLRQQGIEILPIQTAHLQQLLSLPFHHRDPFDRLIIAQALAEEMTLVSNDSVFSAYPVSLLLN
jgi:PIN domain nuclease of toxin-antitoxin system